ncbi:NAD(P)/FAD-dependent oxidoreductase [Sulfurimonas marina]|uniref:FAD-binding oxidoreductase n=1 Tax=Sulfurimonas marina TaxID=2590551 RepID=A0A7M1AUR3_9BACT|nr:FAD-dependent oxidoreductase [Sulfurimonas marina]QOP41167.1 FAD-binding oxidoreductase [Sulfurimonas marina]
MYDVAVIGAGINGCTTAYYLHKAGQNVVVFDQGGIASGGSGAAGAFLSPKFAKGGELKELINSSLDVALDFYTKNFSQHINHHNLLHIAKDEKDAQILKYFKEHTDIEILDNPPFIPDNEYIYTSKSALVDAQSMCEALIEGIELHQEEISSLELQEGVWNLNGRFKAKKVVIATGAYEHNFFTQPYQMLRGIWGHRIDIKTSTKNETSIHQFVSISAANNGVLSIGATHNVHYHPQRSKEPYNFEEGRAELLEKASRTLELQDVEVIKDYVGLRSGSFDYLPIVGEVVDVQQSLNTLGKKEFYQKKPDLSKAVAYENLYMINGSAGYGYVLAPYLAQTLVKNILEGESIPSSLNPARFFFRWAKGERKD